MAHNEPAAIAAVSRGVHEFAAAHGLSVPTVHRLIAGGSLTAVKVGRRTLILAADEARWLESLPRIASRKVAA